MMSRQGADAEALTKTGGASVTTSYQTSPTWGVKAVWALIVIEQKGR